jgi:hypothetical protein
VSECSTARLRSFALAAAALALALTHSGDASARKFRMSGDWVMRKGAVFWPLQFAATAMGTGGG